MWKNNMEAIARVGALTRPQFRNMPTLDLGGAVDNFMNARDKSLEAARRQAYVDELTQAHPEDAAKIAANPEAYMKMLNDNAAAERDQQFKMDQLKAQYDYMAARDAQQNANQIGLAKLRVALENQMAEKAKAERAAQLDEALKSGMISQDEYNLAKRRDMLGDIIKGVAFDPKNAMDLRKEFQAKNKDYYTIGDAYSKMRKVSEKPSAAGDISMIFNYMKMLDPGSVVREGEYATAQNAAGVPTRVVNMYNRVLDGTRLSDDQRTDFLNQAQNLYNAQTDRFNNEAQFYTNIANQSGIDPQYVVYNPYNFNTPQTVNNQGNLQVGQKIGGYTVERID